MPTIRIERTIQRQDPFRASDAADARGRAEARTQPKRVNYFAGREVQRADGSFPFGEGYLYGGRKLDKRDPSWKVGHGTPGMVGAAGNRGRKPEQQDAFDATTLQVGGSSAAVLVAADGVSASGSLAARASQTAVKVFLASLRGELKRAPTGEAQRHAYVERAMERAAFVANFEVVRQVLFDFGGDGRYDVGDKQRLHDAGIDLPVGSLTPTQMASLAPRLDHLINELGAQGRSALTTFAVAVVVDNDVYTFSSGDAVVSLFRPSRPEGRRLIHLTERDQAVVELYTQGQSIVGQGDLYENVITDSLGGSAVLSGRLRRYPNLLESGDRLLSASDGLGPREPGHGLDRDAIEKILVDNPGTDVAEKLVAAQMSDLAPGEYQDNIGVTVLTVD